MARIYGVLSILSFAFTLYCLLDAVLTEQSEVRNLPKLTWVLMIVILPLIGGIVWLVGGRPPRATLVPGGARARPPNGRRPGGRRPPPKGPDDDPRFLRELEDRLRRAAGDDSDDLGEQNDPADDDEDGGSDAPRT